MSRRDLIDPDVREPLDQLQQAIPGGFNTIPDIVQRRATLSAMLAAMEVPPNPNVASEDRTVPGPEGAPDITAFFPACRLIAAAKAPHRPMPWYVGCQSDQSRFLPGMPSHRRHRGASP
jgi:hypothetical protein